MSQRPPYYIEKRAARQEFKPYDRRRARRDLHDVHNLSYRLSSWVRKWRKQHR